MKANSVWVITGTDTGIGKTVFSALLTKKLNAVYWKPIQSGIEKCEFGFTDKERVKNLTKLSSDLNFLPEAYVFEHALSPYAASCVEGVEISPSRLTLPERSRSLVVEGAGGLMVPLTKNYLQIDLFEKWKAPLILCARTALGTINHTLLSIEAIKNRNIPLLGIVFIGESQPFTEEFIPAYSGVKKLGHLPFLGDLHSIANENIFDNYFSIEDFVIEAKASYLEFVHS